MSLALANKTIQELVGSARILRNTGKMQTWLPLIKEPEENNTYGWLPSPSDLPDNVQHLLSFPIHSHFF
jgi:hypothetical protein